MTIAALYVETGGCYFGLKDVDPWDEARDARQYGGAFPVVAHPPWSLWTRFAHVNFARWGGVHNKPGNDGGCFASALSAVRQWGGVLEHPAFSDAWKAYELLRPTLGQWREYKGDWVTEVWQSAYGHKARKRTWLLYCGKRPPFALKWGDMPEATHQIGHNRAERKPTLQGKQARATPLEFRDLLLDLARQAA